ncbi:MAG: sensor histidine kinase [Clostridium sp.]|uniref:sensor histidine kinase n=1 Tax=Clostridium sp. TaxID=1506 RepID=UPI003F2EAC59
MVRDVRLMAIRYIGILIGILDLFVFNANTKVISLIFILLYILNNNVRIFYLKKDIYKLVSIILEIIGIGVCCYLFNLTGIFFFVGVSIDIFSLKNRYVTYSLMIFILGVSTFVDKSIGYLFIFIIFFILLDYLSKLYNSKVYAENLYDKLRISEEKLKTANYELEMYALSIEELTLLKERNRISREIHDSVGHALSTTMIQLNAMEALLKKEDNPLSNMAYNLREFVNESLKDVRLAVREIKPDNYSSYEGILRIRSVFTNFEKLSKMKVEEFISNVEWELSEFQISNIYRISQEVLSNALRHGKGSKIRVIMNFTKDEFIMSFKDNGVGCENIERKGIGLKGIEERVNELNGRFEISSKKDDGFFVKIIIPRGRGEK